jgi:DNA polymerase
MDKRYLLDEVAKRIASCQKCSLYKTATCPVPGNGDANAKIMFIGEAPGFNEDQQGIPFCGAAGHLLDQLLNSIGLNRKQVFVANMLKHRPPNNRDPLPEEMENCKEYLDEQLEIIKPETIITLGRFSMAKFYPYGKISIDHGKGRVIEYNGLKYIFIPMFHPAAALRGVEVEKQLREDFKKIQEEIERLRKILNGIVEISVKQTEEKKEEKQLPLI